MIRRFQRQAFNGCRKVGCDHVQIDCVLVGYQNVGFDVVFEVLKFGRYTNTWYHLVASVGRSVC